jgi:hypothetical protein
MESCSSQKCYKDANISQQKNKQPGITSFFWYFQTKQFDKTRKFHGLGI